MPKYSAEQRRRMARRRQAMPGGRYPIGSARMGGRADLRRAIRAVGRGKGSHNRIRRHIVRRARALGASRAIPDSWDRSTGRLKTARRRR